MRYNGPMAPPTGSESLPARSLQEWLAQGELLYAAILKECHSIESQMAELENRLAARQAEANQIAHVIGKPVIDANRRLSAQLVTSYAPEPSSRTTSHIARALSGARPSREIIPPRDPLPPRETVPPRS